MTEDARYRALICITTCNRVSYLRRYAPHFARFCADDERFSLLVSLDGQDRATTDFCAEWTLPLLYSDEREGVGLSKNRVLERFPGYDYYFFLDDDVELIDGSVFPAHVELARASKIHHFSLFKRGTVRGPTGESVVAEQRIRHGLFGGGQFNFYTGEGLRQVGGWHPLFAQFRRWGHTEHSYRFFRAGLAPAPFNVAEDLSRTCIWHYPPTAHRVEGVSVDADQIAQPERALIDEALVHVPVQTIAPYHLTSPPDSPPRRLASVLDPGERYPLVDARERRECRAALQLWKFETGPNLRRRVLALGRSALLWPANPMLRDTVKGLLRR